MQFTQCPIFSQICEPFWYQFVTGSTTSSAIPIATAGGSNKGYFTIANDNLFALTSWKAQTSYDSVAGLVDTASSAAALALSFQPNAFKARIAREQSNLLDSAPVAQAQFCSSGYLGGKQAAYPVIYSPNQTFNAEFIDITGLYLTAVNQSTQVNLNIKAVAEGYHIRRDQWDDFLFFRPQLYASSARPGSPAMASPGIVASSPQQSNVCDQFIWQTSVTIASNVVGANIARAQFKTDPDKWTVLTGFRGCTNYDGVQEFTTATTAAALRSPVCAPNNFEVTIQRASLYNLQKEPIPQAVICSSGYRDGAQLPWAILYPPSTTFDFVFYNVAPQLLLTPAAAAIDLVVYFGVQGFNVPKTNLGAFMSQWPTTLNSQVTQRAIETGTLVS